jgi:hypothetical protein
MNILDYRFSGVTKMFTSSHHIYQFQKNVTEYNTRIYINIVILKIIAGIFLNIFCFKYKVPITLPDFNDR